MGPVAAAVLRRRGLRREQRGLAEGMRAQGATWVEVARVFQDRYRVNARTALRLARGWSQPQAAGEWNRRWPDETKTLKNFSYWENWPARTGREPSLRVLGRLAELYECHVGDLVADLDGFAELDPAYRRRGPGRYSAPVTEAAVHFADVPPGRLCRDYAITAETSDGQLEVLAARIRADEKEVDLVGLAGFVRGLRERSRDAERARLPQLAAEVHRLNRTRNGLIRRLAGWGDTADLLGTLAHLDLPEVNRILGSTRRRARADPAR